MAINIKNLPPYVKVIIVLIPSVIVIALFIFLLFMPKNKEIKSLKNEIARLDNEIATGEVKIRKLPQLKAENAKLKAKLAVLKRQLPEEEEVSLLLKQVSDLAVDSGLAIESWVPGAPVMNPEGLYKEIPVNVVMNGNYHDFGIFFGRIGNLQRIVNLAGISLVHNDQRNKILAVFNAVTFSAVPEGEAPPPQ